MSFKKEMRVKRFCFKRGRSESVPHSAAVAIASNSSSVSGSGFACVLLAREVLSTTPGRSASLISQACRAGILSSAQSVRTQSSPSSALASSRPVSRRAMAE